MTTLLPSVQRIVAAADALDASLRLSPAYELMGRLKVRHELCRGAVDRRDYVEALRHSTAMEGLARELEAFVSALNAEVSVSFSGGVS